MRQGQPALNAIKPSELRGKRGRLRRRKDPRPGPRTTRGTVRSQAPGVRETVEEIADGGPVGWLLGQARRDHVTKRASHSAEVWLLTGDPDEDRRVGGV